MKMIKQRKILIVDDDESFVQSNSDLLEAYGYNVLKAYNGETGFQIAKMEHPDLMVLDVMMTYDTEGFEIARKVRDEPELKNMKVLLVSGITREMHLPFPLEADETWLPVDRIMEKPIDPARFISEIEKVFGG